MRPIEPAQPEWERERILALKGSHQGPGVILANGPSLALHDLTKIPKNVLKIGVNQSWKRIWPDVHLVAETIHCVRDPGVYQKLIEEKRFYGLGGYWPSAAWPEGTVRIRISPWGENQWCDNLENEGATVDCGVSGTVSYAAFQMAHYIGCNPIYFVGLDLHGKKFTGQDAGNLEGQRGLFNKTKHQWENRGIKAYVIDRSSKADAFERIDWPWGGFEGIENIH